MSLDDQVRAAVEQRDARITAGSSVTDADAEYAAEVVEIFRSLLPPARITTEITKRFRFVAEPGPELFEPNPPD